MASGVQVSGLRETVRNLERYGAEVSDLKAAFGRIGKIVVDEAKNEVPHLSGALSASIRASKTKNKSVVRAGGGRVVYAGVQNYGGYNNIAGSHFLDGAVQATQGEVIDTLEHELESLARRLGLH